MKLKDILKESDLDLRGEASPEEQETVLKALELVESYLLGYSTQDNKVLTTAQKGQLKRMASTLRPIIDAVSQGLYDT
jgi:hypothetical protein